MSHDARDDYRRHNESGTCQRAYWDAERRRTAERDEAMRAFYDDRPPELTTEPIPAQRLLDAPPASISPRLGSHPDGRSDAISSGSVRREG